MSGLKQIWVAVLGLVVVGLIAAVLWRTSAADAPAARPDAPEPRTHLDHAAFFDQEFASGQQVTAACLECHEDAAAEVMATAHYQWVGEPEDVRGDGRLQRVGKRNLINNYCIGIAGNWNSCTRCHAGYGWEDASYTFDDPTTVDCLVCHDRSGQYAKGKAGRPREGVDLQAAARSVGYPRRDNCGVCHHFGGGGLGVKHGDLDTSLDNPDRHDDVHMGGHGMLCIDCHADHGHDIRGNAFSVSTTAEGGIGCTDCHAGQPHADPRLDAHTAAVACQTCHIPTFANSVPTKMTWDWSQAGDDTRPDDPHSYLKIKGEFAYDEQIEPEYRWFDRSVERYLLGDPIASDGPTDINRPRGARGEPGAKIWPFKIHRARQPYDRVHRTLIPPVTAGEGGFWREFDWEQALRLGAEQVGLEFSGDHGFTETWMYWPLSHLVQPAEDALGCTDCHGDGGRLDWQALGYAHDPIQGGALATGGAR
jgi:octaheme c-type cytochrome (tetrathionate reductase family)